MKIIFDRDELLNLEYSLKKEYLLTNGKGGYSSSTILDCHTRKYHGLLILPLKKKQGLFNLLSKLEVSVLSNHKEHSLSTNKFPGVFYPIGHQYIESFEIEGYPITNYTLGEVKIRRSILMPKEGDCILIKYELLSGRKAGFVDRNKDGIREDIKGNPIKFTLITNAENNVRRDIGVIISEDLRKIGFDVGFAPIDFNKLVNILTSSCDWDAMLIGLTGGIEPHSGKNVWESTGELHFWNPEPKDDEKKKSWQGGLSLWEKDVDTIFNKGASELNEKKRKALYDKWQVIVSQQLPLIYTVNPATLYAVRNKFTGIKPTAYGGCLHNLEEISIKPEWR